MAVTSAHIPGKDEASGRPRARVSNAVHHVKNLLAERKRNYWPENSCADISKEELAIHVLIGEPEAGAGT